MWNFKRAHFGQKRRNKVIRPKSRASAISENSGKQTDEQTKTFKKTFELAIKSLRYIFVKNQWTETDGWADRQTGGWTNWNFSQFYRTLSPVRAAAQKWTLDLWASSKMHLVPA